MFRTIIVIIRLFFYLLSLNGRFRTVKKLSKDNDLTKHDALVSTCVKEWAKYVLKISGVNVFVSGIENIPVETVIFVCNHRSFFDIPVLLAHLDKPYGLMSKDSIGKIPFLGKWMRELNCVFVDRDNPRKAVRALELVGDNIDKGYSMIIFPEGTRNKTSDLLKFKTGAFKLATKKNVSIVPIALSGTDDIFEKNNFGISPGNVTLRVLPKILVTPDSNYKDLLDAAHDAIQKNLV